MFDSFGSFEMFEVTFEIYLEDKLINKQTMQAPKEILIANFLQTVQQMGNDKRAMRLKMFRPEIIWDNFEQKQKILNNEVTFSNNAYISYEESKDDINGKS